MSRLPGSSFTLIQEDPTDKVPPCMRSHEEHYSEVALFLSQTHTHLKYSYIHYRILSHKQHEMKFHCNFTVMCEAQSCHGQLPKMVFADASVHYIFKQKEVGTKSLEILVKPRTTVEINS